MLVFSFEAVGPVGAAGTADATSHVMDSSSSDRRSLVGLKNSTEYDPLE